MRDELLKNNIIKAQKAIIDIGTASTKVLEVSYTSKEIKIDKAYLLKVGYNGETSFAEIAKKIDEKLDGRQRKDIIITIPSTMTEGKIISVKNKNDKESKKIVHKQCRNFGRSNPITHVVNASLIGTREEQGDTVTYYLISSVSKGGMNELIDAFADFGMKITRVVSNQFNQVCLSELFAEDFNNINRILVDFGNKESRITVFADKVAVYSRNIPIGFQTYVKKLFDANNAAGKNEIIAALINIGDVDVDEETAKDKLFNIGRNFYYESISDINKLFFKEFSRILDMCGNSDIEISKIYLSGFILDGFLSNAY